MSHILAAIISCAGTIVAAFITVNREHIRSFRHRRKRRSGSSIGVDLALLNSEVIVIDNTFRGTKRISFQELGKQLSSTVIKPLLSQDWRPNVIVASGRGGAFCGAVIGSVLKQGDQRVPIRVVDITYRKQKEADLYAIRDKDQVVQKAERILVCESSRQTFGTYPKIIERIKQVNPTAEIRDAVLVWAPLTEEHKKAPPKYLAYLADSLDPSRVRFPWYLNRS